GWVSVHLDARREGVKVPADFNDNRHLVLQYGRDMPVAIPDLTVDDDGIRATLSFSRTPHSTFIPWNAVYIVACTDGRGILYYEDVPEDVSLVARAVDPETGEPIETGDAGPTDSIGEDDDLATLPLAAGAERKSAPVAPLRRERLLKSVPASEDDQEGATVDAAAQADSPRRRKRPQLKLVK
ncbi:MAG TPA: ClpXP protease specificity-enhancing factor SspB, partial [Polyangia bacterium]